MRFLLDTQALILAGTDRLPKPAREIYSSPSSEIFFSVASLWEIGIKASLGKLQFKRRLTEYSDYLRKEQNLDLLQIEVPHLEKAVSLPWHHKDPFDRLLVGQALTEGLCVISGDPQFDRYGCKRAWN